MPRSPRRREPPQAYVTSSSGRGRTRTSNANMELCGEARTQKPRPSRVRSGVSFGPRVHAVTQRVVVATVSPGRCAALRWVHPTSRPGRQGGARNGRGATGSGRVWQSSQNLLLGAVSQNGITQLQIESNLRGKRSDPSHGANARPQAGAVPLVKVLARNVSCRRASTPSGERVIGR